MQPVELVTIDEVKLRLKVDNDDADSDITLMIQGASASVIRYLKNVSPYEPEIDSFGRVVLDSSGDPIPYVDTAGDLVPLPDVKNAVLALVGQWLKNPDGNGDGDFDRGYLPKPVTALLYPLRVPTIA